MVHQTNHLLSLNYNKPAFLFFVFFSTICSYNFHWYLTPVNAAETIRSKWTRQHKWLHILLIVVGIAGSVLYLIYFFEHWLWLGIAATLTFLYSAPKLPSKFFGQLKKIAVGKTIFLSFVWTYVTSVLPVIVANESWQMQHLLFCASRFFLIYAICIIFDYRDREQDKKDGIKSMITYFNDRGIDALFYASVFLFMITTFALIFFNFHLLVIIALLIPGIIVLGIYKLAKKNFSDYLYYFVLDGLMMFSALFTSFIHI